jgi:hypothetical protein
VYRHAALSVDYKRVGETVATRQEQDMQDNSPLSTGPQATATRQRRTTEGQQMIDSVRVAPDTFGSLVFLGSSERKEFTEGKNIAYRDKPQQYKDGVPVWTVQLAASTWRNPQRSRTINVNIPCPEDPSTRLTTGELVELHNAVYGVTPHRDGNGYSVWMTAEGITASTPGSRSGRSVAASASS